MIIAQQRRSVCKMARAGGATAKVLRRHGNVLVSSCSVLRPLAWRGVLGLGSAGRLRLPQGPALPSAAAAGTARKGCMQARRGAGPARARPRSVT